MVAEKRLGYRRGLLHGAKDSGAKKWTVVEIFDFKFE